MGGAQSLLATPHPGSTSDLILVLVLAWRGVVGGGGGGRGERSEGGWWGIDKRGGVLAGSPRHPHLPHLHPRQSSASSWKVTH